MYKIFLTLRYLTRKKIVIFPILVVWLCLMMMIIVTSIMGGFVDRVRQTNRELLGDIIIWGETAPGWSQYDELQKEMKEKFPDDIAASTPVAHAYGLINVPAALQTKPAEVMGVDPVGLSAVTRYRESLFKEYVSPHQAADDLSRALPADAKGLVNAAEKRRAAALAEMEEAQTQRDDLVHTSTKPGPNYFWLNGLLVVAAIVYLIVRRRPSRTGWSVVWGGVLGVAGVGVVVLGMVWPVFFAQQFELAEDRLNQANQVLARAQQTVAFAESLTAGRYTSKEQLLQALVPAKPSFALPEGFQEVDADQPSQGCVVGVDLGFFRRDQRGNYDRTHHRDYIEVLLTVFPASDKTGNVSVNRIVPRRFRVVDDSHTGVYDIDKASVYAPLETVQVMAGMRVDPEILKADPKADFPPRCNELLIRLKNRDDPNRMKLFRARLDAFVRDFQLRYPNADLFPLHVETWDERQAKYLGAVENEKIIQTFILGLMSMVVLVVIFLIFYMIVRDKTRDIGIIKAIGGSEEGVAGIFLTYGLFIGVVGGVLGVIGGVAFVTHTNEIHEWIYRMTGIMIWDRSVYLFDRIPDTVRPVEVAVYFGLALLAGVVGALIPAIVAGSEDPVKAVRYE